MRANASSTSPLPMVSLTKWSRSRRPCVKVDQHREVAGGQAVAVPRRFERPARPKKSIMGTGGTSSEDWARRPGPPCRPGPGRRRPAGGPRAGRRPRWPRRPRSSRGRSDRLHGVLPAAVDGVGGPTVRAHSSLRSSMSMATIVWPRPVGPRRWRRPRPAAAEHRHAVTGRDLAGMDGGPDTGHDAAAQQTGRLRAGPGYLGALACRHQCEICECAYP